jgi:hypothetical protein
MEESDAPLKKARAAASGPFACCPPVCLTLVSVGSVSLSVAAISAIVGGVAAFVLFVAVLALPQTVSCIPADEGYYVKLYGEPEVISIEPPMTCVHYEARGLNVTAANLLLFNGIEPALTVDDLQSEYGNSRFCQEFKARGQEIELCGGFNFTLDQNDTFTDIHNVSIFLENYFPVGPDDKGPDPSAPCNHDSIGLVVVVPPPTILDINPPVICAGSTLVLTVSGTHFVEALSSEAGVEKPIQTVGSFEVDPANQALEDCQPFVVLAGKNYSLVETCGRIDTTITAADHAQPGPNGLDGLNTVSLINPDPLNCLTTQVDEFRVISRPVITSTVPPIICTDEEDQVVTLVGSDFLRLDGLAPLVTYDGVSVDVLPVQVEDNCVEAPVKGHAVHLCPSLRIRVTQKVEAQPRDITITVSPPVISDCEVSFNAAITVVPAPQIDSLAPNFIAECLDEQITVAGSDFFFQDSDAPSVEVGGSVIATSISPNNCAGVGQGTAQVCSQLTFNISAFGNPTGVNTVRLTNPEPLPCSATSSFRIIPAPAVEQIAFPGICAIAEDQVLVYDGVFVIRDGTKPTFTLGPDDGTEPHIFQDANVALSNCVILGTNLDGTFEQCDTVALTLQDASTLTSTDVLAVDGNILTITNPSPVDCVTALDSQPLLIVTPPSFDTLVSDPNVCMTELPSTVEVTGTFVAAFGFSPQVFVEGTETANTNASSCTPITIGSTTADSCTAMTFDIDPLTPVTEGFLEVELRTTCSVFITDQLFGHVNPTIDALDQEDDRICSVVSETVVYTGNKITVANGRDPVVTLGGVAATRVGSPITADFQECIDTNCTQLSLDVPANSLDAGFAELIVGNVAVDSCATTDSTLRVEPVPVIDSIFPTEYCVDQDVTLTIRGSNFSPFLSVKQCLTDTSFLDCFVPPADALTAPVAQEGVFVLGTEIEVFWDSLSALRPTSGVQDIEVTNVAGCSFQFE